MSAAESVAGAAGTAAAAEAAPELGGADACFAAGADDAAGADTPEEPPPVAIHVFSVASVASAQPSKR